MSKRVERSERKSHFRRLLQCAAYLPIRQIGNLQNTWWKKYGFVEVRPLVSDVQMARIKYAQGVLERGYPKKYLFGKAKRLVLKFDRKGP